MGRLTGKQRSTITKPARPMLMPWEVKYQHTIQEFFKAPQVISNISQATLNPTHSFGNVDETVSQQDNDTFALINSFTHGTNCSKDSSSLEVKEEAQEDCEGEICGSSIISDNGKDRSPCNVEAAVQIAKLPSTPTGQREAVISVENALGPHTCLQLSPVRSKVAFNHNVKRSSIALKAIKYAIDYNLDELFSYAFAPGKVSLKRRLTSK